MGGQQRRLPPDPDQGAQLVAHCGEGDAGGQRPSLGVRRRPPRDAWRAQTGLWVFFKRPGCFLVERNAPGLFFKQRYAPGLFFKQRYAPGLFFQAKIRPRCFLQAKIRPRCFLQAKIHPRACQTYIIGLLERAC